MKEIINVKYVLEGEIIAPHTRFEPEQIVSSRVGQKVFYKPLNYDLTRIAKDQANEYSKSLRELGFSSLVCKDTIIEIDSDCSAQLSFIARRRNEHKDITLRFKEDRKRKEGVDEKEGWFFNTLMHRYIEIPSVEISLNYIYSLSNLKAEALAIMFRTNKG